MLSLASPLWASETEYAALTSNVAHYEFSDGAKVDIITSGKVDRRYGLGLLVVERFEIRFRDRKIDSKELQIFLRKVPGIKFGTIHVSRDFMGIFPEELKPEYTLKFEFLADAFGPMAPRPSENRKTAHVRFSDTGITDLKID